MNFKAFTPTNLPHPFNFPLQTTNTTSTTYIMPHTNYLPKALPHSSLFKTPLPSLQELEISIKESYFEGKGGVNAKYELTDEKI